MPDLATLAVAGVLLGMMRAGFGGGVGVVAAPVLALVMPAKQALGVILPLTLCADAVALRYYWRRWSLPLVWAIMPGCLVGLAAGWLLLDAVPEEVFRRVLGVTSCLFAALQLFRQSLESVVRSPGRIAGGVIGAMTGIVSVMLHSGGVVLMLYLAPQGLTGRGFVATAFLIGVILNVVKIGPYVDLKLMTWETARIGLWMLPSVAAGALSGILLNHKLPVVWFNRAVLAIVLVVGVKLVTS